MKHPSNAIEEEEPSFETPEALIDWINNGRGQTFLTQLQTLLKTADQKVRNIFSEIYEDRLARQKAAYDAKAGEKVRGEQMISNKMTPKLVKRVGKCDERCKELFEASRAARHARLDLNSMY
jgi:hypothetical protein